MIRFTEEAIRNGSTFISIRRRKVVAASFVCKVEITKCPVSAEFMEISAVSSLQRVVNLLAFSPNATTRESSS